MRIDNLIKEARDLKHSLEYTQSEVDELKQLNCVQLKFKNNENNIDNFVEKADDLENRT